jgi:hypothetical protein
VVVANGRAPEGASAPGTPWSDCAQPVEGPRPDLRFDPRRAEGAEGIVTPIELDDVRLPSVAVTLRCARREHEVLEPLRVPARDALTSAEQFLEARELWNADRAGDRAAGS